MSPTTNRLKSWFEDRHFCLTLCFERSLQPLASSSFPTTLLLGFLEVLLNQTAPCFTACSPTIMSSSSQIWPMAPPFLSCFKPMRVLACLFWLVVSAHIHSPTNSLIVLSCNSPTTKLKNSDSYHTTSRFWNSLILMSSLGHLFSWCNTRMEVSSSSLQEKSLAYGELMSSTLCQLNMVLRGLQSRTNWVKLWHFTRVEASNGIIISVSPALKLSD